MKIGVQNLVTLVRFLSIITVGKMQLLQSIKKINQSRKLKVFILKYCFKCPYTHWIKPRGNEGTEREAQGVGRDMSCPRKLFLDERKSLF